MNPTRGTHILNINTPLCFSPEPPRVRALPISVLRPPPEDEPVLAAAQEDLQLALHHRPQRLHAQHQQWVRGSSYGFKLVCFAYYFPFQCCPLLPAGEAGHAEQRLQQRQGFGHVAAQGERATAARRLQEERGKVRGRKIPLSTNSLLYNIFSDV